MKFLKCLSKLLLYPLFNTQLRGLEHLKSNTHKLLIANQSSRWDLWILLLTLPQETIYLVDNKRKNKILKHLKNIQFISFSDPNLITTLISTLEENKHCLLFPEVSFSSSGGTPFKLHEFLALLIKKRQYPVIPIGIRGSQNIFFSQIDDDKKCWNTKVFINILPAEKIQLNHRLNEEKLKKSITLQIADLMTKALFETWDYNKTLMYSLIEQRKKYGWNYPIIEDAERIPMKYGQLLTHVFVLAKTLDREIRNNDFSTQKHIALLLPNTQALLISFFSLQLIAKTPAILNFSLGFNMLYHCCQIADIKMILTSKKFITLAKLEGVIQLLQENNITIHYLEDMAKRIRLTDKLSSLLNSYFPHNSFKRLAIKYASSPQTAFDTKQTAVVLFTSGSEGFPKGVRLSHQNLQANRMQAINVFPLSQKHDKVLNSLPMFHSLGLTMTLLPLLTGIPNILYPSPLHFKIINDIIYQEKITLFASTNSFLHGHAKNANPCDFHHLRYIVAGAEQVKSLTHQKWAVHFGVKIFEGYGASECSPVISFNTPAYHKIGTAGRILPAIEYKIEPIDDMPIGGKLLIKGPNRMQGYLHSDDTESSKDWYDTQDIVSIDDEGYITILDRLKRFAKIAGEMISLTHVENHIFTCWPAHQSAIITQQHESRGEQLILITTHPSPSRKALLDYAKTHGLAEMMIPKLIIKIDEIPMLGNGKTNYVQLTQWYEEKNSTLSS